MNQKLADYYNSLSEAELYVIHVAAFMADDINYYSFPIAISWKTILSTTKISKHLENAYINGILTKSSNSSSYSVIPEFLIYILPQKNNYSLEWEAALNRFKTYYLGYTLIRNLKDFLYSLLFDKTKFAEAENRFLLYGFPELSDTMTSLLENEAYTDHFSMINIRIIKQLLIFKANSHFSGLLPIEGLRQYLEKIKTKVTPLNAVLLPSIEAQHNFHLGNISEALSVSKNEIANHFMTAIGLLQINTIKPALIQFEKGLKAQRSFERGTQLPSNLFDAFYHLVALLQATPEESAPIFQKIDVFIHKKNYKTEDEIPQAVLNYYFNDKEKLIISGLQLKANLFTTNEDYFFLINFLTLYLVDIKVDNSILMDVFVKVNKAYSNGYRLLAYEGAYILKQWLGNKESQALYEKVAGHFEFEPILSHISRQEEWEKALNAFLSINTGKSNSTGKDEQGKYRVVYYVSFKRLNIQPVLQTRTAKGLWSSGRNIALKTFSYGKVDGMTQQDSHVANMVRYSTGYYGAEEYILPSSALKELVGHPYVFLEGTNDLPIELIAAQPILRVTKIPKGFTLSTDIDDASENLHIVKETNTRYKIYDLTIQQRTVIEAIKQQKITVPEQGKEKLMQVLGNFSSHFMVHSDLSVSEHSNVKKVSADSRIRVQLLPMGQGLKAELFAKPFGSHPPYCKPGKGGKTLIANEKGVQLQVSRDLERESAFANELLENIQALESIDITDDLIAFGNPLDSLNLLDILSAHLDKCVVEWPEGERYKIKGTVNFSNLNLKIKTQSNWFELQGELKVDEDTVLTIQQLLQLTEKGYTRFIELKNGEFLALSERLKKQLDELRTFSTSGKNGIQINKFASVALGDFFDEAENLKTDKLWKEFQQRLTSVQNADILLPANLQADLRPYQEEGFRWLTRLAEWDAGACLSDDMGLGKTIQALAVLLHRAQSGAALVICPVSVIHNWMSETAKFAPGLKVKTLSSGNREQILNTLEAGDLLITSYGLLQSEEKAFSQTTFASIVLDEAHTIKNYNTKTSKAAMQLQAPFRMVLTGTPIQNHLGEIWNLFNFINPGLLGSLSHFTDTYIKPDNDLARKHLKKLIAPFILRRTKSSVLDELPAKTEVIRKVELSTEEMAFYEALRRQAIANLENDSGQQGAKHLKALAEITRLRQACCNPAIVNPLINISSSKLSTFLDIVAELIENKHKALVFSQFVTHLTLVRQALDKLGISYQYLDGSSSLPDREKSVKKFQGGEGDLFLISLKAGGLGLNLTAADYVIHLDPWWNPAVEDQASDRAHRIGQMRPVTIYRLVAQNTIEEKIIKLHNTKRDLADSLLEGSDQSGKLSMAELVNLIKDRD